MAYPSSGAWLSDCAATDAAFAIRSMEAAAAAALNLVPLRTCTSYSRRLSQDRPVPGCTWMDRRLKTSRRIPPVPNPQPPCRSVGRSCEHAVPGSNPSPQPSREMASPVPLPWLDQSTIPSAIAAAIPVLVQAAAKRTDRPPRPAGGRDRHDGAGTVFARGQSRRRDRREPRHRIWHRHGVRRGRRVRGDRGKGSRAQRQSRRATRPSITSAGGRDRHHLARLARRDGAVGDARVGTQSTSSSTTPESDSTPTPSPSETTNGSRSST